MLSSWKTSVRHHHRIDRMDHAVVGGHIGFDYCRFLDIEPSGQKKTRSSGAGEVQN
jgi:hypothetical protein